MSPVLRACSKVQFVPKSNKVSPHTQLTRSIECYTVTGYDIFHTNNTQKTNTRQKRNIPNLTAQYLEKDRSKCEGRHFLATAAAFIAAFTFASRHLGLG